MSKLIVGCGYLGQKVAERWVAEGEKVFATTRSVDRAQELSRQGLIPILMDLTQPELLPALPEVSSLLVALGYDRRSSYPRKALFIDGMRRLLEILPPSAEKLILISSTGVYGNHDGQWIDESTPCMPKREAGQVLLSAEDLLRSHPFGSKTLILRLAGIYGPGRIPQANDLRHGRPLKGSPHHMLNLIHVDDAATAIVLAEKIGPFPGLFVLSDGCPVFRQDFYGYLAELLNSPPPVFGEHGGGGTPEAGRDAEHKRVNNSRIVRALGLNFRYPGYREGLRAIVAAEADGQESAPLEV